MNGANIYIKGLLFPFLLTFLMFFYHFVAKISLITPTLQFIG